ncbi:probable glutamate receptor [Homarus americanus]|uniref:probable glutamate receptor n=1 Tax=Homarus americanus TaxID=6706 RepID=UPI001C49456A|nr:probable glutamate receptor [Homarus americanus]
MEIYLLTGIAVVTLLGKTASAGDSLLPQVAGNVTLPQDEQAHLAMFMNVLASKYTSRCLRALVGDAGYWVGHWDHAHVIINPDYSQARNTVDYMNENTEKVTTYSCVTYMMTDIPRPRLLASITDLSKKQMTRYFLAYLNNVQQAHKFLLDDRLKNEEHVAALVKLRNNKKEEWSWQVLTRQLLHPSGSPEVHVANMWSQAQGLRERGELFPEQMKNFYGTKLQGVTLDFRPFTDYEKFPGTRVVRPKPSLDVFILDVIADNLNFTYELVMPEDGLWGYINDDGHWVGVVGDVEFRRANFSLVVSVTLERRISVDFTRSYYRDPLSFVTAKSRSQPPWLKLFRPFSNEVWLLAAASVGVAVVMYYIIFRAQATLGTPPVSASRAFMYIFGSFLSQALFVIPWLSAGQVLLSFWFIYALLLTTYYKTSLTAALAVPSAPPTIDTLDQLIRSNLEYGMIDAKGSEYQLFSSSNVPLYQEMFKHMNYYSSAESMNLVAEGKYAYIYFKSNLETIVTTQYTSMNGETDLHVAYEEFFPGGYGWAFPKGAPYRRTFDDVMWRCVQGGLIAKWMKDLHYIYLEEAMEQKTPEDREAERQVALNKGGDSRVVLDLNHLQGPFLALLLGSSAGIFFLLVELVVDRVFGS